MIARLSHLRLFVAHVLRRFSEEDFGQLSASLAFTTLLSLVPFVAVVLGILSVFPVFLSMADQFDHFVVRSLLPERNAGLIIEYVLEFSQKATKVTLAGLAALVVTVLFLLRSIEQAFNNVWRVTENRSWWKRLRLYAVVLTLWPFVVACVVLITGYAVTVSLGLIDYPEWLQSILLKAAGLLVATISFAGFYYAVPNAKVEPCNALGAGLFASFGFMLMQKGFELYLSHFPSFTLVYGAFAIVPIFLMWLYLSWAVVLLGALIAASLSGAWRPVVTE